MGTDSERKFDELRKKAEMLLETRTEGQFNTSDDILELLHELEIRQTELEIQNEELQQAQTELSSLHREYSDLYEFAPCGYITLSPKSNIARINLNGAVLLGKERALLQKMPMSSFIAGESKEIYNNAFKLAGETGKKQSCELRLKSKTEEEIGYVHADIQADCHETGEVRQWWLTLVDITERKKYEDALRLSEEKFRNIFNSTTDATFIHGWEGAFLEVNDVACENLGYKRDELLRMGPADIDVPEYIQSIPEKKELLKKKRQILFQTVHRRKDGKEIPVEINSKIITYEHKSGILSVARDITERKRTEQELRVKNNAIETAINGIVISDLEGKIVYVNPSLTKMLGYDNKQELIGRSVLEFGQEREKVVHILQSVLHGKEVVQEITVIKKDNTPIDVQLSTNRVKDEKGNPYCVMGSVVDITDRKKVQKELEQAHKQLFTVLENQDAGVFVVSQLTMKILFANKYLQQFYQGKLVGLACTDVHENVPDLCSTCKDIFSSQAKNVNDHPVYSLEIQLPDTEKWFLMQIRPIQWVDETPAILHVLTDITPMKEAEQLREDIDRITRHDLKSPLNGILGAAQLMTMDETLSEENKEYVEMIEEAGKRMLTLIDQTLGLYKMEQGTYEIDCTDVNIGTLLHRIKRDFRQQNGQKQITIALTNENTASSDQKHVVWGEELLCYSLFSNLVNNAIEASKENDTVCITLKKETSEWIAVSIWNRKEIPKNVQNSFGEKYSTAGKKRGTGLGVYSAKLMTNTLGGTFRWTSSEEEGTTITVVLPAVPCPHEEKNAEK